MSVWGGGEGAGGEKLKGKCRKGMEKEMGKAREGNVEKEGAERCAHMCVCEVGWLGVWGWGVGGRRQSSRYIGVR